MSVHRAVLNRISRDRRSRRDEVLDRHEQERREEDPQQQAWARERFASGIERLQQIVDEAKAKGMTENYVALITVRQAKELLKTL